MKFKNRIYAQHNYTRIDACTLSGYHTTTKIYRLNGNHSRLDAARVLHTRATDAGYGATIDSYAFSDTNMIEPVVCISRTYKL